MCFVKKYILLRILAVDGNNFKKDVSKLKSEERFNITSTAYVGGKNVKDGGVLGLMYIASILLKIEFTLICSDRSKHFY